MTVIKINVKNRKHYQQLRKDIGAFLFMKRQQRNYCLHTVARLMKLPVKTLDEIELGKCNLRLSTIIKLLGLYRSEITLKFEDCEIPVLETK